MVNRVNHSWQWFCSKQHTYQWGRRLSPHAISLWCVPPLHPILGCLLSSSLKCGLPSIFVHLLPASVIIAGVSIVTRPWVGFFITVVVYSSVWGKKNLAVIQCTLESPRHQLEDAGSKSKNNMRLVFFCRDAKRWLEVETKKENGGYSSKAR